MLVPSGRAIRYKSSLVPRCGLSTSIPHAIKTKSTKLMDSEKIETALLSALSLLNNEVNNIEFDELKNEYLLVIEQLEKALNEITKDE